MDLLFRPKKLEREYNERGLCVKAHGQDRAGRPHELGMNRKGQLSMDLDYPCRLSPRR